MFCKECEARAARLRAALLKAHMGGAVKEAAKGAAELVGLKKKTATQEDAADLDAEKASEGDAAEEDVADRKPAAKTTRGKK